MAAVRLGLSDPRQDTVPHMLIPETNDLKQRKTAAIDFQKEMLRRAGSFQQAIDRPANSPPGLQMMLIAGDGYPTADLISVNSQSGRLQVLQNGPGDELVLRGSALLDERMGQEWSSRVQTPIDFHTVLFLPERHLEMIAMDVFRDNILFWLLEDDR